jgi:sterol desaturase/sphingolipid hydroxylase (fatty acid hydroxylase superfamily)
LFCSLAIFALYGITLPILAIGRLPLASIALWWLGGFFAFTLFEYLTHRYVFHLVPHGERGQRFQYAVHGNHHQDPDVETRVMMRPSYAVVVTAVLTGLFGLLLGGKTLAFAPGFVAGYGLYLLVHYAVHAYRPPRNRLRLLWRHHHLHHYSDEAANFGVSSPLWDFVFRTYVGRKTARPTNRTGLARACADRCTPDGRNAAVAGKAPENPQ